MKVWSLLGADKYRYYGFCCHKGWIPWVIWISEATSPLLDKTLQVFQHLGGQLRQVPWAKLYRPKNETIQEELKSDQCGYIIYLLVVCTFVICMLGNITAYIFSPSGFSLHCLCCTLIYIIGQRRVTDNDDNNIISLLWIKMYQYSRQAYMKPMAVAISHNYHGRCRIHKHLCL